MKQGRGLEVRLTLCPALGTPVVVQPEEHYPTGPPHLTCQKWHTPQVDLFTTRFNRKLPWFVSLVSDKEAWVVDVLSLS